LAGPFPTPIPISSQTESAMHATPSNLFHAKKLDEVLTKKSFVLIPLVSLLNAKISAHFQDCVAIFEKGSPLSNFALKKPLEGSLISSFIQL
jgi:hypothetical protein